MVLNICELDDTHLKQGEERWEGAMIEGRKEGGWKKGEDEGWVLRGAKTEKQQNMEETKKEGERRESDEGEKFIRRPPK